MDENVSIKIANHKCFKEPTGFDKIKPVNFIVGKNNSGKTTLLEMIECSLLYGEDREQKYQNAKIIYSATYDVGYDGFPPLIQEPKFKSSAGDLDCLVYIKELQHGNYRITWEEDQKNNINITGYNRKPHPFVEEGSPHFGLRAVSFLKQRKIKSHKFIYLSGNRDIVPEPHSPLKSIRGTSEQLVDKNGNGATNIIQNYLHDLINKKSIEKDFLAELNKIIAPESEFKRITSIRIDTDSFRSREDNDKFEICLEREDGIEIPLSKMGHGIKTVMLILLITHIIPHIEQRETNHYVFGIEEPENNLHPSMLRRLLTYIMKLAKEKHCVFFVTTHSSTIIDLAEGSDSCQIVLVKNENGQSQATEVNQFFMKNHIIEELGNKASDILQANCLIWVEGPSDRIYVNKWIELYTDGNLTEGTHYHCLIYGGKLLSHLKATPDDDQTDLINMIKLNRNTIALIDRDKNDQEEINDTKKRIKTEIENVRGYCWITDGREIENYVSAAIFSQLTNATEKPFNKFNSFEDIMESYRNDQNKDVIKKLDKLNFARLATSKMTKSDLSHLDLNQKIKDVVDKIYKWNNIQS